LADPPIIMSQPITPTPLLRLHKAADFRISG